ncbi:hypothetical protein PMZ80_003750 [Knufia obscura]|uniref:Uncharacterized protein n=2 Tax=Knufia TaxID=430999 RepID=A0AAN8EL70_9EURO|nr:hypothetical protein PMZ80_003750 [Knufia obscura]KAK5958334.1 hypothetical protein OHC33_000176 [Knufia fluminis]
MAPHAGVIIAASVLVAASIAAYENPQVREWFERSSQKVALAFRSIGDDIHGRKRQRRQDLSMHENDDEKAEQRRRQAREEIMEKGRALQERRKKRRPSADSSRTASFDSMVDEEGRLRAQEQNQEATPWAASTAVDLEQSNGVRSRNEHPQMHESVDAPILLRQLNPEERPTRAVEAIEPWESQYEQEMRNAWNMDLPSREMDAVASHASESLIDLTPTTEDFPDPDYSVPSLDEAQHPMRRSDYFSAAASQTSHTLAQDRDSSGEVPLSQSLTPLQPRPISQQELHTDVPSSHASLAGSTAHIGHSEAEMTDDDFSDFGDGVRTPASAWTEVGSSVSGDD